MIELPTSSLIDKVRWGILREVVRYFVSGLSFLGQIGKQYSILLGQS